MKIHTDKFGRSMFYILLVVELLFLLLVINSKYQSVSFHNESLIKLNNNWTYKDNEGNTHTITIPSKLDVSKTKAMLISNQLPKDLPTGSILGTLSSHQSIHVYVDNELIYTCDAKDSGFIDLSPGSMWNLIHLPDHAAGKEISLDISTEKSGSIETFSDVYIGTKAALLIHIIQTRGFSLLISFIILFIGINLVLAYFSLRSFLTAHKSILYLGSFSLIVSIWMIMESDMAQFFVDNRYLISSIKYLCLNTLPIPLLLYLSVLVQYRYRKLMLRFSYIFITNAFVMLGLQLSNIANLHEGLIVLHVLIFIIFSIVCYTLCIDVFKYKNKKLYYLTLSFGFLFLFTVFELLFYYFELRTNTGTFMQLGMLVFLLILSRSGLLKTVEIIRLSENASFYKHMANWDYMTKCKNRTAYTREINGISLNHRIAIIMADVNNMKFINDTYGHLSGDEAIILCGQCLLEVFQDQNKCYRIGGDEFLIILIDEDKEEVEFKLEQFNQECKKASEAYPFDIDISIGYAFYDKDIDETIYDTIKRADKNMYDLKAGLKNMSSNNT